MHLNTAPDQKIQFGIVIEGFLFLQQRDENWVVADVCIYPQDQLQRDQLYQDQLHQDANQRRQLQQEGDQGQGYQGQNQHEVSIYPDLIYPDFNYPDLNYSRIAATEVCFPAVFSDNKIYFMLKKKNTMKMLKMILRKYELHQKFLFLKFKNPIRLLLEVRAPSFLLVPQMLNVRFPLKCSM